MSVVDIEEQDIQSTINDIMVQYYLSSEIPSKIYVKEEISDIVTLEELLSKKSNKKVSIIIPKIGDKLKLIQMVENNIKINLEESQKNVLADMSSFLNTDYELSSIEAFDISNLKNEYIVGAMIRFEDRALNKSKYRKFKIKSTLTQNDPLCMYEVITRRLKRRDEWELPDMFLIDGGRTQLEAVKQALNEQNVILPIYGMIKDDRHRTRGLIDIDGNEIIFNLENKESKRVFNFITFLQDEVHRFVIRYHRSLRDKI